MFGRLALATALLAISSCATAEEPSTPFSERGEEGFPLPTEWAQQCEDWDDWDKPAPPFRIHGSTFHVGTCGISVVMIANPEGHILIDSGTEGGAMVVLDNIRSLGFAVEESFALVLHSHEHHDHVGGFAVLQEAMPKATYVASEVSAHVIRSGKVDAVDPQALSHEAMTPARIDRIVKDGETLSVEFADVTAIATPGHTPGAMSWQWEECDGGNCKTIVYADSLSPVSAEGYRFSDHPEYLAAYRESIATIASLDCDILLTPHPSASGMRDKLLTGDWSAGPNCAQYAASVEARLNARLAEEAAQ